MMFLAVTGGRHYKDEAHVFEVLNEYTKRSLVLILGDATGVDTFARTWAENNGIPHTIHYADWDKHGKAAGPLRNKRMLEQANMLLAFSGGKGTENCISQAKKAGIKVRMIE
jgi:hypothetical protein